MGLKNTLKIVFRKTKEITTFSIKIQKIPDVVKCKVHTNQAVKVS